MPLPVWSSVLEVHAAAAQGGGRQLIHDTHLTVTSNCSEERVWDLKWWECGAMAAGGGGRPGACYQPHVSDHML